jgi:SprT protein
LSPQLTKDKLSKYFPVESVDQVVALIEQHRISLKMSGRRTTKLGDFKPPSSGKPARITINGDMNVYSCLLIFLHELAHLLVWESYGRQASPHGKAWKQVFGHLIREFVGSGHFHRSLMDALMDYSHHVKATGLADEVVVKQLRMFDHEVYDHVFLEELPDQAYFVTKNGKMFRKENQIRTRYKCYCPENRRFYLFHPLAKVKMTN